MIIIMKLSYFNINGIAETSRILLAVAGVDYEDFRYPLKINDWKTYDFTRDEFDKDKADGKLWKSMDKLPFLEVNGKLICQSKAIERYIATRYNLMGDNLEDSSIIDSYCEWLRDFKTAYHSEKRKPNKEEAMDNWFNKLLIDKLKRFDNIISNKGTDTSEYAVGNKLSLIDISIYTFLTEYFDNKEGILNAYKDCPRLKAIVNTVSENDKVKHWLKTRPVGSF